MINIVAAKTVVETWNANKVHNREFVQRDMRKFIEIMNDRTKALIHWMELHRIGPDRCATTAKVAENCVRLINGEPIATQEEHNDARMMVSMYGVNEAEFYTGLMELYVHAATLLTAKARIIADGIDRTNV